MREEQENKQHVVDKTESELRAEEEAVDQRIILEQQMRLMGIAPPPVDVSPAAAPPPDVQAWLRKNGMDNALISTSTPALDTGKDGTVPEEVVKNAESLAAFHTEADRPLTFVVRLFQANGVEREERVTVRNADPIGASLAAELGISAKLIARAALLPEQEEEEEEEEEEEFALNEARFGWDLLSSWQEIPDPSSTPIAVWTRLDQSPARDIPLTATLYLASGREEEVDIVVRNGDACIRIMAL